MQNHSEKNQEKQNQQKNQVHLVVENLRKEFDDFIALENISLSVEQGEFVCFLGPSGCGKTTLLRAIAGLDMQTSGKIFMQGQDVSNLPPSMRDFGIVFQNYALFPNLTVNKNIAYGMQGNGLKKKEIKKQVKQLLQKVGLDDQGKKYPKELSGGQQQRVALARALAVSPSMLLLDEPLSALDAKVRSHLRQELKSIQKDLGVTTIMVTHDQEEALSMADRIVLLRGGKIEQIGTPEELYSKPANAFVADFIGEMNFIPAERVGDNLLKVGDLHLHFDKNNSFSDDKFVSLAIRPENIKIGDMGLNEKNTLNTLVLDSEFLGNKVRAKMSGGDLSQHSIRADISMDLVRSLMIANGKGLPITMSPDKLMVFNRHN